MEANVLIPLIAGLAGAILGALSSIVVILIQQKAQSKRDRLKLACEMAAQDRKHGIELAQANGSNAKAMPVVVFQHFHLEIIKAMESGKLTDKKLIEIKEKNKALIAALENYHANS
ncbi:MAG TPA: hypothetical protein ENJ28_10190 [Gammaproteobacteria bacterium]|nr:hypothetical protein [Gammaproteobacteria bacterium]